MVKLDKRVSYPYDQWTDPRVAKIVQIDELELNRLDFLKLDVEGWEFRAIPEWLRQVSTGETTLQVQQLQMEFHRIGWKRAPGASWESLMNSHLLFLHFYALGFVPVQYERNHMDDCCYEFTFVNAVWYVVAEHMVRKT